MAASGKADDEDYWDKSTVSNIKRKGFNLFDENVDAANLKQVLKKGAFDDDDDDDDGDVINWDGSSASSTKVEYKSARYRAPGDSTIPLAAVSKSTSSSSVSSQSGPLGIPGQRRPIGSMVTSVSQPGFEPSISDVVGKNTPPRPVTQTEMAKLEAEVNYLKRHLEYAKKEKWSKISPEATVKRIILGEPHSLEFYKSREDKVSLLDAAIKYHDGNAIIKTVLFLRDTIKPQIFNLELMRKPVAIEHFINYLRQQSSKEERAQLTDILGMLGRTDEEAMLKYKQAVFSKRAEQKMSALRECLKSHFQLNPALAHESYLIQQQIALLERQLPIQDADAREAKKGTVPIFKTWPLSYSVVDQPLIITLYYCCFYHFGLGENSLASPVALKKAFSLSDKQFTWAALSALAMAATKDATRWQQIEQLFLTKGWLGGTKMKAVIPFDRILPILEKHGAPRKLVLCKYCSLIDDVDKRLEVGSKYGCHESIIETFRDQKDRAQLSRYQASLKPNSEEWYYANDVLNNSSVKWKN